MNRQIFTDLLEMKEFKAVKSILEDMDTATIAELLGELKEKERREAFGLIETPKKEKVFAQLDDDMQSCLAKTFTEKDGQNTREVQEKQYFDTSVLIHAKNRIGWLLFLMLSATITQTIIAHYESAFAAVPLLVSFIPMLTDTGGNCGSQSSTLIIRGIALDEIGFRDIFKVMFKEVRVSIFHYLLKNRGKIVSRDELMDYLWDCNDFVDDNTLTVNINRLRKKLEEIELTGVIETRRRQGYILI